MGQVCWQATAQGRYWIDIELGNQELHLMVDLGLTDSLHRVGFEVDPSVYDQLQQDGQFADIETRAWRDASGRSQMTQSGLARARLIDPVTRQRVGPVVRLYANRGTPGVPSRVGVEFFHSLVE